jgi:hypothetical protein
MTMKLTGPTEEPEGVRFDSLDSGQCFKMVSKPKEGPWQKGRRDERTAYDLIGGVTQFFDGRARVHPVTVTATWDYDR